MQILKIIIAVLFLLVIFYLIFVFAIKGKAINLDEYKGDGTIKKIGSSTFPGYEIEFTRFNISKHHRDQYRLEGLPKLDNAYFISLRVYEKYEYDIAKPGFLNTNIHLKISDVKGEILFEKKSKISEWRKTSSDGKAIDFYYAEKNIFSGFNYTALDFQPIYIEFEYVPALSKNKKLNIDIGLVLRCGGHK